MNIPFFGKVLAVAACCGLLSGCYVTAYVHGQLDPHSVEYQTWQDDKIIAMGYVTQNGQKQIIFVGEKYSYIMENNPDLQKLFTRLTPQERVLISPRPIALQIDENHQIHGVLDFRYPTPESQMTPAQKAKLNDIAFRIRDRVYDQETKDWYEQFSIHLNGRLYQTLDKKQITTPLQQSYPIQIKQKVEKYSTAKAIARPVAMPFTYAADIALLPIVLPWYIKQMSEHP